MKYNRILTIFLFALCTGLLCLALSSGPGTAKTSQQQYNPVARDSGRDAQPKQDSDFRTKAVSQLTLKEKTHWSSPVPVSGQNDLKRDGVGGVVINEHLQSDLTPDSAVLANLPSEPALFPPIANDFQTDRARSTFRFVDFESLEPIRPLSLLIDGYEIGLAVGSDGAIEVELSVGEHVVEVFADGYVPMRARHGAVFPRSAPNVFNLVREEKPSTHVLEHKSTDTYNVSGWVRAYENLRPLQGAHVLFQSSTFTIEALTNDNGEFNFTVPPNAFETDWEIQAEAPDRRSSKLAGRGQADLPTKIKQAFLLQRESDTSETFQEVHSAIVRLPSEHKTSLNLLAQAAPNTIRVGMGAPRTTEIGCSGFNEKCSSTFNACSPTNIDIVDTETYVKRVFRGELYGTIIWDQAQLEAFKANAVAIRTYASFNAISSLRGSQYDICNSDSCQCYFSQFSSFGPTSTAASQQTAGQVLLNQSDVIPKSEYGSWNGPCARGIMHCTAEAGYPNVHPIYDYAIDQNWNLRPSDPSFLGHGRGMSQYGSHFHAANGELYQQILSFYYQDYGWRLSTSQSLSLTISAVTPTVTQTLDWGLSATYTITVVDNGGTPVSGSIVNVSDGIRSVSTFTSPTNSSGQTTYTTTVPSGKADGTYDVVFTATKSSYISSSSVTRQVQVRHNVCSIPAAITSIDGILNWAVNANDCTATPTASLTSRSVSSTNVLVNQPLTVSTTLSVSNATADHAGISISFPSLTNSGVTGTSPNESYNSTQGTVSTASYSSITGGSTLQYWGAGETLPNCNPNTCLAQHLLVEGDWVTVGAGNTRTLTLTVTPKVVGTFKVRIRGWATAPGYQNPSRDPSSGGSVDQQSFPVYEITVNVSATPTDSSVQFSSATYSVNEDGGSKTITVTRTGGTNAFSVNYRTSNGTATAGADYTGLNGVLDFATNETSKTFTVPIINDTLVEGDETLNLTLSNPSGGVTLGSPSTAVLTIVDNDTACTYSISESEHTVSPDDTAVKFFMDAPSGCAWTAVSDSPSWLTTSSSGSGDGTINYNTALNPSSNPRVGHITVGGQVHTVTQIGVGGAGNVRFSSATYTSTEGGGAATITVTRTGGTGTGSVQYSTSNGTATAGTDYVSASGTLLFVGNETSKSFNVTILDDTTFEGDESFTLSLKNNSSSFTLGSPSTAILTIIENDISPDSTGPGLSINSHSNGDTVSNSSISLSGTASDSGRGNNGISSVTVNGVEASGGTASGSGTANWSRSLTLNQGTNNITVVARDNSSNQNSTTQSITLYYQPIQTYTIAVSASPSAGGTVGGDGTFAASSSRTVTASANNGYSFVNWTENGSVVSSSASYTFTLNINRTLVANFSIVSSSNASYDSTLKAPKCLGPGSVCDSGTLLNGRGNITGGAEPNQPNTIYNSCADNMVGSYHSDESIDRIRISTLDGSSFALGKTVKIEVTVWAFSETGDFLDLFYTDDATNPNWAYITTLTPSTTGAQVLSTTFTLPSGGSLQAVRANFLYQGALTPCSGGIGIFEDHDDLVFAVGSGATQSLQLLLEESGPSSSQAAALDSMLFLRDPFPVVNVANLLNLGLDRNTRVIIYATNLQLMQDETSSSVVVNLIDSSGLSYDVAAEDVRPVPNFNFTQVTFRLPNNLTVGTCTIKLKAHGQVSNAGTIRIRN